MAAVQSVQSVQCAGKYWKIHSDDRNPTAVFGPLIALQKRHKLRLHAKISEYWLGLVLLGSCRLFVCSLLLASNES